MTNLYKKENTHCSDCSTKSCFVQQFCVPTWVGIINQSRNHSLYKKGQHIFREGDRVFGLYFIQRGKVKVVSTGLNGREQIVRLAAEGHILGHMGYGAETYPVGAVALEDSWLCFLDNATLQDVFVNNPKFTYGLMMFYSTELRKTEVRLRCLAQMTLREKIAESLLTLKKIFGVNEEDGTLNVTLSRQEMADIAGTTAEQVTRELTNFENELLITKQGKKIVLLNADGLFNIIATHNVNKYFAV